MSSRPKKIYYDRTNGVLRDADGAALANQSLFPVAVLGQKFTINLQIVVDDSLTAYPGFASGVTANVLVDNDFSNYVPFIPMEGGDGNWTVGTGSEYYYRETSDLAEKPASIYIDDSVATEGTAGSLEAGEWGWDSVNSRLYIRLSDGTDPDLQADGYVKYKPTETATKPFIEVDAATFNAADSWYDSGTGLYRAPVITAGEISFQINANTAQFYNRLGSSEQVLNTKMQIQLLETGTTMLLEMIEFVFLCKNRFLLAGAELEVEITNYHTKAEADARYAQLISTLDIEITSAGCGLILPDGAGNRRRITPDTFGRINVSDPL